MHSPERIYETATSGSGGAEGRLRNCFVERERKKEKSRFERFISICGEVA